MSDKSVHLFDYYKVDNLHGLNKQNCIEYKETKDDAYIAGMANTAPDKTKPYVFINSSRLVGDYRDTTLVMHEMMHMSLLLHKWDMNKEEDIVTWAEQETNWIMKNYILNVHQQII
jgi:hypothetical protein